MANQRRRSAYHALVDYLEGICMPLYVCQLNHIKHGVFYWCERGNRDFLA